MNRLTTTLVALGAAAATYFAYFQWATSATSALVPHPERDVGIEWLRSELDLDASTCAKIEHANAGYLPRCEAMCQQLELARGDLFALLGSEQPEPAAVEAALTRVSSSEAECAQMTLQHILRVSDLMTPEKAKLYRAKMTRHLFGAQTSHHEPHGGTTR